MAKTAKATSSKTKSAKTIKVPSTWYLLKDSALQYWTFWRSFAGILVIYAILYFIMVLGLSFTSSASTANSSRLTNTFKAVLTIFSSSTTNATSQSNATVLMQFLLFLLASLAFVWTLRQLQHLKRIKLRDAYYRGTASLIPTIIVTLILSLTLVPAILGSAILAVSLQAGAIGLEVVVISIIAGLLLLLSIYLFMMFWPAFYIVSLPAVYPFKALRSAMQVTKKHRLAISGRVILLIIFSLLIFIIILVPVALAVSVIVPETVFVLLFILFGFVHIYLYKLYRSLL